VRKLFHGTTPTLWAQIKAEGLKPNDLGIVFLTPLIEDARLYGGIVLEVDTDDLPLSIFENPAQWEALCRAFGANARSEVLCWGPIPPERVRLRDENAYLEG